MRDKFKSLLGIFVILLIFVLGYISYDHIDNSYMLNEPDYVNELEAANDSLETLVSDLEEQKDELQEELDDLKEETTND
jgi:peptidoglycan hydrolase CwlO-like protein